MTHDEVRVALNNYFKNISSTLYTQSRIYFEGEILPDLSKRPYVPFVAIKFQRGGAEQISLGTDPPARYEGFFKLTYFAEAGKGTVMFNQFIDLITTNFKTKSISGVLTRVPRPLTLNEGTNWNSQTVLVPIEFDTLT